MTVAPLTEPLRIAKIGAAHGVRGECRVKPFTEDPEAIGDYGPLRGANGAPELTVVSLRVIKNNMLVVRFDEVRDRNHAEELTGTELFVERSALGDADEGDAEFFVADLVGLAAVDQSGLRIGEILDVADFGAGDLLDIKLLNGRTALLPFVEQFVPEVDMEARRVVLTPPEGWDD